MKTNCRPRLYTYFVVAISFWLCIPFISEAQVIKKPDTLNLVFSGDDSYPPYEFINKHGEPDGFDVALMKEIAKVMGIRLEIKLGDWYQIYESFENDEIDGLIGAYYTELRAGQYLFGDPYVRNYHTFFIRQGSSIRNLNDFQRCVKPKVITQNNPTLVNFIKSYNPDAEITIVRNYENALRLLAEGSYDCAVISRVLGEVHIKKYGLTNIESTQEDFLPREYSFMMHPKDSILLSILNRGLTIVRSTGTYDKLYNTHLKKYEKLSFAERYFKTLIIGGSILILNIFLFFIYIYFLRKQVAQKTKELAFELEEKKKTHNMMLIERDKARESDKLKSAFLANMSHEIRTPMNAIVGFSRLLNETDITAKERENYANIINKNSEILLALISDIIDIAKIESGQILIEKIKFQVNDSLKALYETTKHILKSKERQDIDIIVESPLPDEEAYITTDIVRYNQIFQNLLSNSIKFTHSGSITLGYQIPDGRMITFFVKDTGIGIAKENQKIVFEQFRQADESFTRKYGGTGLGLTICSELATALGGEIWIESTIGEGTIVYFSLPWKSSDLT